MRELDIKGQTGFITWASSDTTYKPMRDFWEGMVGFGFNEVRNQILQDIAIKEKKICTLYSWTL